MSPQEISYWFDHEIKPHEGDLRGYLYQRVDQVNDIDDIVQETFKRIIEVRRNKQVSSPRSLMFTIAINLHRDQYRKRANANTSLIAEMDELQTVDAELTPPEALCHLDELEALKEAIRSLPPKCREIFILRKFDNLSQKEIASRLKISVNTVETQLGRALDKCQRYFERNGLTPGQKSQNGS